ncbi:MAG: hypothetical protein M0Z59_04220 [Nitrospiraceae bacterium]|nr:hypothetical protein [Nitrospiraceae bacterium]
MRILHILSDGPGGLSNRIIELQSVKNEISIIDLSRKTLSYDSIIDEIAACDRLVSW